MEGKSIPKNFQLFLTSHCAKFSSSSYNGKSMEITGIGGLEALPS